MSVTREITIGCSIKLLEDGQYFADVKGYPCSGSGRTVAIALDEAQAELEEFMAGVAKQHVSVRAEVQSARAEMLVTVEDTRQMTLRLDGVDYDDVVGAVEE